jgi:SAM-dependent methyltransferase
MKSCDKCPVCSNEDIEPLHELVLENTYTDAEDTPRRSLDYRRNHILFKHLLPGGTNELRVVFLGCRQCSFEFFSPRPDQADLEVKYKLVVEDRDTEAREQLRLLVDLRELRAAQIHKRLAPLLASGDEPRRVLDIGGADGHCMAHFTQDCDCGVLDFENRKLWPGVRRLGNTLDDLEDSDLFDVILCNHTLEHIPDLNVFVKQVREHLKEGGLLYVEVPFGCNGEIRRTGNILTHLNFFSGGSLGYLFGRNGLHVEYMATEPVLSKQRYLEVVNGIGRRDSSRAVDGSWMAAAVDHAKEEVAKNLTVPVLVGNATLVLSHPLQYSRAFASRAIRSRGVRR